MKNIESNVLYNKSNGEHSSLFGYTIDSFARVANEIGYKYIVWNDRYYRVNEKDLIVDTDFYLGDNKIASKKETILVDIIDIPVFGLKVKKKSGKPFKSGEKYGFVTGFSINNDDPKQKIAYVIDGDSIVNIDSCLIY